MLLYEWNDTQETQDQFWHILLKLRSYYQEGNVHNMTTLALIRTETPSVSRFYEKATSLIKARTTGITRTMLRFKSNRNTGRISLLASANGTLWSSVGVPFHTLAETNRAKMFTMTMLTIWWWLAEVYQVHHLRLISTKSTAETDRIMLFVHVLDHIGIVWSDIGHILTWWWH